MKWGIAASAILLLAILCAWTLIYGKPAGRTAPKVEQEFHKPSISLGGASNDAGQEVLELSNSTNKDAKLPAQPFDLGGYPQTLSSPRLSELAAQIVPSAHSAQDQSLNVNAALPTPAQLDWLDRTNPLVCGLSFQSTAIACPISHLDLNESLVLQIETKGHAWMLTWCADSQTLIAYERTVEGIPLDFRGSSQRCLGNTILTDADSESQWSQLLGTALKGQFSGTKLKRIPVTIVNWNSWLQSYPQSHLLGTTTDIETLPSTDTPTEGFKPESDWGLAFINESSSTHVLWSDVSAQRAKNVSLGDLNLIAIFDDRRQQITTVVRPRDIAELKASPTNSPSESLPKNVQSSVGDTAKTRSATDVAAPVKLPSGEQVFYPRGEWWDDLTADSPVTTKLPQLFPIYTRQSVWSKFHPTTQ